MSHRATSSVDAASQKYGRTAAINAVIFLLVLYIFGSQLSDISRSFEVLSSASPTPLLVAFLAVVGTFIASTLSYLTLAVRKTHFRQLFIIQIASGFINRLLPVGLGSMGLFAIHLHKRGYSIPQSSAIVASNNFIGIFGNCILITSVLLFFPSQSLQIEAPHIGPAVIGFSILALALFIGIAYIFKASKRFVVLKAGFWKTLQELRLALRPDRGTALSLASNLSLTSLNAAALALSVAAIGTSLGWPAALLVLSVGSFIGATVPTPGGIGGVEAGLLGGLVAFGISPETALPAVLIYRGLTYWLPIIPGILAYRYATKRYL